MKDYLDALAADLKVRAVRALADEAARFGLDPQMKKLAEEVVTDIVHLGARAIAGEDVRAELAHARAAASGLAAVGALATARAIDRTLGAVAAALGELAGGVLRAALRG